MFETLAALSPLSGEVTFLLIVASLMTSLMTAAIGLGGGVALLAVMASFMTPATLIPVHGVVQLGSNAGRAWLHWRHANRGVLLRFGVGAAIGALIGAFTATSLPASVLKISVGVFVLYALWMPSPKLQNAGPWTDRIGGVISTFLTMFFGATGPFVAGLLTPRGWGKHMYMGTFAGCMMMQHMLKTVAFGAAGFDYLPWLWLMGFMVASGYVGTRLGTLMLHRLPEETFKTALKWGVSLIALRLIYMGVFG